MNLEELIQYIQELEKNQLFHLPNNHSSTDLSLNIRGKMVIEGPREFYKVYPTHEWRKKNNLFYLQSLCDVEFLLPEKPEYIGEKLTVTSQPKTNTSKRDWENSPTYARELAFIKGFRVTDVHSGNLGGLNGKVVCYDFDFNPDNLALEEVQALTLRIKDIACTTGRKPTLKKEEIINVNIIEKEVLLARLKAADRDLDKIKEFTSLNGRQLALYTQSKLVYQTGPEEIVKVGAPAEMITYLLGAQYTQEKGVGFILPAEVIYRSPTFMAIQQKKVTPNTGLSDAEVRNQLVAYYSERGKLITADILRGLGFMWFGGENSGVDKEGRPYIYDFIANWAIKEDLNGVWSLVNARGETLTNGKF